MEDYYQADRKGGDDRTRKKKSSSSDRERTAPRDEAGADNISPTRASRRMPPPDAYGAAGAAGGGYGLRPTMDMGVGEQQPSYTRRSSRDVRDDSLAREAAISGVADPKDGRDELSRTGRKSVSSKRAPEVPSASLSSGSASRAAPAPEPYARPLSARHRTTVDLAPQRSIPPEQQAGLGTAGGGASSSSQAYMSQQAAMMNAAMDAEAAAKADAQRDREREKRLQEKREKRRMLMEKEALELARSRPDEGQATSPSVPLQPPAPAPMAADPPPVRKPPPPSSKPVKPTKKAHEEEEGGGYDDDFETYSGDEFEAAEDEEEDHGSKKKKGGSKEAAEAKSDPAPSSSRERKAGSKATSSSSSSSAAPAARKGTFKSCWSSAAGGTRPLPPAGEASGGGVSHKLASALHPRAQRVKQIQSLVPFEVERFVDLNLQPVSMFDIYQRRIRATSTAASTSKGGAGVVDGIHQAGTQTQDDDRSVEVQTEELQVAHQSMQFYLGDDTDFLEAIKAAAAGGKSRKSSNNNNNNNKGGPQLDPGASSRLLLFLQRAGPVCETLLEENLSQIRRGGRSNETDSLSRAAKDGDASVFHKDSSWVRVMTRGGKQRGEGKEADGDDGPSEAAASGWARLLGDRPILEVHSHAHQPHLLMTVHGPKADLPAASSKAAKAGSSKKGMVGRSEAVAMRTVIALWDAALLSLGRSSGPSKLLCGDGVSSCTCFGPGMSSVVVTATETGALHLWDLREPREQHLSTWCLERGLTMGLRAPTYSTLGGGGLGHVSRVVTITPLTSLAEGEQPGLGQGTSSSFQLASLDDRGVLTLWMVNEVPRENVRVGSGASVQEDAGLSLGGRLRLVRSRSLDVLGNYSLPGSGRSRGASFRAGGGVLREVNWEVNLCDVEDELQPGPGAVALAFFPRDPNRFLVGLSSGVVLHCSRFGQAKAPSSFVRGGNSSLLPPCPASALHFNPSLPDHFLVGYEDGLFCLFTASYSEPLRRWDASALTPQLPSSKQLTWALSQEVTWLSWSPHRPSVFWVLLGRRGLLLAFDLLINDQAPIIIEALSKEDGTGEEDGQGRLCVLSLSCEKASHMAAGSTPTLAMASSKGARFRLLRKGLYDPQPDELASLKTYLDSVL